MMTRESAEAIEDQSADWLARIDRFGETPELMRQLDAWLAADSRHQGAFLQAQAALRLLDDHFAPVVDDQASHPDTRTSTWTRRRVLAGTGGAMAASLVGATLLLRPGPSYSTAIGEVRRVPLPDGSIAAINTESSVDVDFGAERRVVRLASGEAWFQVVKNRSRPFVAEAGKIRVRAVGTAFSVRRHERGADVLVSEGIVETWVDGAEGHLVRLSAGQQAYVGENASIRVSKAHAARIDRTLAWRSGQIDLAGESLLEAIAEFNRYNSRKIVLVNAEIANEPLFGVFRTDDPVGFVTAIHHGLNVPVKISDPATIEIGHRR
jgi:transmembrane sensor